MQRDGVRVCNMTDYFVVPAHSIMYSTLTPVGVFEGTFIQIIHFPTINETKWEVVLGDYSHCGCNLRIFCLHPGVFCNHQFLGLPVRTNFLQILYLQKMKIYKWGVANPKRNSLKLVTYLHLVVFKISKFFKADDTNLQAVCVYWISKTVFPFLPTSNSTLAKGFHTECVNRSVQDYVSNKHFINMHCLKRDFCFYSHSLQACILWGTVLMTNL